MLPPKPPKITYPHGEIATLCTNIAWMGDAHNACEVRIGNSDRIEEATFWQSGIVETPRSYLATSELPEETRLYAFVRLRNAGGWGKWSAGAVFVTPREPVIRIESPANAGRVKGPAVTVKWQAQPSAGITDQSISIDGGTFRRVPANDRTHVIRKLAQGVHTISIRVRKSERTSERTTTFYVYSPAQLPAQDLYMLDLTRIMKADINNPKDAADAFDTLHAVACIQGLANRETPRLCINYHAIDTFWLDMIRQKGAYLEHSTIVPLASVEDAIAAFPGLVKGAVVWDPEVPATSNVATTISGVESLLPVRFDEMPGSLYDRIVKHGPKLKVVQNLVSKFTGKGRIPDLRRPSTGSKKCDAYLWAKARYLDTGKCNPRLIGYWCDGFWLKATKDMGLDGVGLTNHDFIVARKGFVCDLDVWEDEAPRDDPNQRPGLDCKTFEEILLSCYKMSKGKAIHFDGFTPWAMKYTNVGNAGGTHDAVPTEWKTAQMVSAYNAYMDADAIGTVGLSNASIFSQCPLPDRLVQNPPPTRADLEAKGYMDADGNIAPVNFIYYYLGDYDSAAWLYHQLPNIWRNGIRGQIPSGWAFNPNLAARLPVAFDWFYETKTPLDFFIAGDSGAGYVNPTQLLSPRKPSDLPSGANAWIEHNAEWYRKFNYSITGFLINGLSGELTDDSNRMYAQFSGDGIMTQPVWMPTGKKQDHLLDGMPVAEMKQDIYAPIDVVVEAMLTHGRPNETAFLSFRSIVIGPEWIKTVTDKVRAARPDCRFEPVDPYTYFYLLRHSLGGRNEKRATYTFDTMPDRAKAGEEISVCAGLRNDGWETWESKGPNAVRLHAGFSGRKGGVDIPLPEGVPPGGGAVVSFKIAAPAARGMHTFSLELVRGKSEYFGDAHDLPWQKEVRFE